jgi:hypothetical protein
VTGWLVPSAGQKIPIQPSWYLPLQKILLAENMFLQAGKGAENTKEKIQAVLYGSQTVPPEWNWEKITVCNMPSNYNKLFFFFGSGY